MKIRSTKIALLVLAGSAVLSFRPLTAQTKNSSPDKIWGNPSYGCVTSISTEKTNYLCNELIKINVSIKNVDTNVVNVLVSDTSGFYGVNVAFTNGQTFFQKDRKIIGGSAMQLWLKPGEEYTYPPSLSYPLQIDRPGIYRIKLFDWFPGERIKSSGISNEIEIRITDNPSQSSLRDL